MDPRRVDLLLQYAIACAAHQAPPRDELSTEHLQKLVYLADLEHARGRGRGRGYTGARWEFARLGPTCAKVQARVEPVMTALGIEARPSASERGGDWMFACSDRALRERLDGELPLHVSRAIKKATREFAGASELPALLTAVYRTGPMLRAAPGEALQLERVRPRRSTRDAGEAAPALTPKQQKRRRERARELKARLSEQRRMRGPGRDGRVRQHLPAYSRELLAALEQHARAPEPAPDNTFTLQVDDSSWRGPGRSETDVP